MNKLIILTLILTTTTFAAKEYGNVEAKYVRNYDGDTVTVNIPSYPKIVGDNISVRVNGVDTPEIRGKCTHEKDEAKIAKKYVANLLKNAHKIELKHMQRDKYFRILADVYYDGNNLSDKLISQGLAYSYNGGKKVNYWC